ncbi:MAG: SCO family protein [Saprospiraceae bacterium]|nr:SCO family protein [Saprospiraceae bacterium]
MDSSEHHSALACHQKVLTMRIKLWLIIGLACFACHTSENADKDISLPYYSDATFTPHWHKRNSNLPDDFHRISDFNLINQNGESVSQSNFQGKIYVADFFFTACPGICPKMTDNMLELQSHFIDDEEVLLISHSVTPGRDSVPVLKAYAARKGIASHRWHLVTGSRDEIYRMGRDEYFVEEDLGLTKEADEFLHTENFVLVDHHGYLRGIYNGLNRTSIAKLIKDIKVLKRTS